MNVAVNGTTYRVYFSIDKFSPKFGDKDRELTKTTCHICEATDAESINVNTKTAVAVDIATGSASQNYRDKPNGIIGRKVSFTRALTEFDKPDRTIFWTEFKDHARYKI